MKLNILSTLSLAILQACALNIQCMNSTLDYRNKSGHQIGNDTKPSSVFTQIPEMFTPHVLVSDPDEVAKKMIKMQQDDKESLHIVFDFDYTLSLPDGYILSTLELFSRSEGLPKELREAFERILKRLEEIVLDEGIPNDIKTKLIDDKMELYEKLLRDIPWNNSQEMVRQEAIIQMELRDGVKECFDLLQQNSITITILSCGFEDVIEAILEENDIDISKIHIIANDFKYKDGKIIGFTDKFFHYLNKNEISQKNSIYAKVLKEKENIILVGDWISDVNMASETPKSTNKLTIGFLNEKVNFFVKSFTEAFDIVLIEDRTMNVIIGLLKFILQF